MKLGNVKDYSVNGNAVTVGYEGGEVIATIIRADIIRVLNPVWMRDYVSVAIEGEKCVDVGFEVEKSHGNVVISTEEMTLSLGADLYVCAQNAKGEIFVSTYDGKRQIKEYISEKDKKELESEGHQFKGKVEGEQEVQMVFDLAKGDCFYGLGDKTGYLNKRGYVYENWNSDIPQIHHENMPALYKSIPFLMIKRENAVGGLFFDNTFKSTFNLGKESDGYFFYGADKGNLDMYIMAGERLTDIVEAYTYLTGRAPLPQLWTLGYHQCRWGYECAEDIREVAHKMRENNIPCESVQYDIDYMEGYRVFTWNEKDYGAKGELFEELAKDGFKPIVIIDPATKKDEKYFMYQQGLENDYFAKDKDGKVYENAVWPGISTFPDFGRSDVRKWWSESHKNLTDMGVMGIWNDMNEPASFNGPLPMDVQLSVNDRLTNHEEAHNTYGHFMSRATYEGMKELTDRRPLVITRAAYAGTQKYSAVWTGDNQSVWAHVRMLIPQLCNLGMSGYPIAGTDIGGFGGETTPELLTRWIEAAVFSTFFRNHSVKGMRPQEPWQFSDETVAIYRKYVELHYKFLPYIYDLLYKSQSTGLPVMRPLVLHYQDDKNTFNLNDEFLVGEDILVCPVVEQGATKRMCYIPEGVWVDYWTRNRVNGGQYIIADAPLDTLPMYIREGAIIPTYEVVSYVGEKKYDKLILLSTGEGAVYEHYQDNGVDFAYENGEYNLYRYEIDLSGQLTEKMLHQGFETYKEVELVKL